jgi:hypothetical protein
MVVRLSSASFRAENASMKALLLFVLTFSSFSFAQGYRMSGNFTLFSGTFTPLRASYTLMWTEKNGFIEGRYTDDVLAANAGVTGAIMNGKRQFQIVLPTPDPKHGVKSLSIETTDAQGMTANAQTTVLAKDLNGNPMQSTIVMAGISPDNSGGFQAQESSHCAMGFGALTGYCGLYAGNFSEINDSGNVCQLANARLELATNGDLNLYFDYNGTLTRIPRHSFGSLLGTPMSQNVNATVRHCGSLPGTNLNSVGCQVLKLVGSFQDFGTVKNFSGTYDIRDEVTGNTCGYSLNLGRDSIY